MTCRFLASGLLAIALLSPVAALAQSDDERARMHFQAAVSYFDQRRYEDALREFEESYRLSERDALLINIATVYERMDDFPAAITQLERYLELAPEAENRRTVESRIQSLRDDIARAEQPEPAEPRPSSTPSATTAADPPPSSGGGGGDVGVLTIVGIAALGVAVLAAVPAIALGVVSQDHYQRVQDECGADGACPPSVADALSEGPLFADVSTALTFVAIGAALAGGALIVVDLVTGGADDASARLRLGPGSISLGGAF